MRNTVVSFTWLLLLGFLPSATRAELYTQAWAQRYTHSTANSQDAAYAIAHDSAGDVIVVGSTDNGVTGGDVLVLKYAGTNGTLLWQKTYNGADNLSEIGRAVVVDPNDNIIVSANAGPYSSVDFVTLAYSSAGVPQWTNHYNPPGTTIGVPTGLAVHTNGNVYVAGYSTIAGNSDFVTLAYSSAGVPLWTNRYDGPTNGYDVASGLTVDVNGNVIVTGSSTGNGTSTDFATIAYSSAGVPLWTNRYSSPGNYGDTATAIAVDRGGNVYVTGETLHTNQNDYATIKYSAAGVALWTNIYIGPATNNDIPVALVVDANTNVIVTGYSIGNSTSYDYATVKYSGAGTPLWTNRYAGPTNFTDQATALSLDVSNNVYVTGYSGGNGTNYYDYLTIKYASNGVALWTNRYDGPAHDYDYARAITVTGTNVFVTGYSSGNPFGNDVATLKYSTSGALIWSNRFDGVRDSDDHAVAVAVDKDGNIITTGYSFSTYTNYADEDFATIKYSSTGVALWTNYYNGLASSSDHASAIAVDTNGNVFVTGYSYASTNGNQDYATIKYSSAGVPLWTNRFGRIGTFNDLPQAIAVDTNGNVFVTGYSYSSSNVVFATIKYANAGTPLWTNFFVGTSFNAFVYSLALDTNGNVFVAGYSIETATGYDFATIKYSNAGTPLWTNRYSSPGNGTDQGFALALDSVGNVYVGGTSSSTNATIVKYSNAGTFLWTNILGAIGTVRAIATDDSGRVFVAGYAATNGNNDWRVYGLSNSGVPLWTNSFAGSASLNDLALAVAVDANNNVIVYGSVDQNGLTNVADFMTIAYSPGGVPLCTNRYNGPANGPDSAPDFPHSLAITPDGFVLVGTSDGNYNSSLSLGSWLYDYVTVKYTLVSAPQITGQPVSVTNFVGTPAACTVIATGSSPLSYQWRRYGTNLFDGSNLSGANTNTLSLVNARFVDAGDYSVVVTNASGSITSAVAVLTVICPVTTLSPASLPGATVGSGYSQTVTATGGFGPYGFAVTAGALPGGLILAGGGGLSGVATNAGLFNFTITVTDTNGCAGSSNYSITAGCPTVTVNPTSFPNGTVGSAYNQTNTATGGTAPYTYAVTGGTLPAGLTLTSAGILSGTPTNSGNFNFTITATDANHCTGNRGYSVTMNCPAITVNPASLPNATNGLAYNQILSTTGGAGTNSFSVTSGALPGGLTLSSGGTLSGVATNSGAYNFTVTATDTNNCTGSRSYVFSVVGCPAITVNPSSLPNGTNGVAYNQSLSASGGAGTNAFAVTSGALAPGLVFSGAGILSGTPTNSGNFNFTITATDTNGCTGNRSYVFHVSGCSTIVLGPASLPGGTVGTPYNQTNTASGGAVPHTFAVTAGSLPTGLSLSSAGVVSGTAVTNGTFNFTVTATDTNTCTGSSNYSITMSCPGITVNPTLFPSGTVGSAYNQTNTATGGIAPYTYTVTSGALPPGLALTSAGILSGTPTNSGNFNFTVTATDTNHCTGSRGYSVSMNCPVITVNPASLPDGTNATAYNQTITASGGTPAYAFTVTSGALPGGLTLSGGGTLSGTPTNSGTFNFTITATDTNHCTGNRAYVIIVGCPTITINPPSLPGGLVGMPYNQTNTATGGAAPYTFTLTGGALPPGLSLSGAGVLSGTPTTNGNFNFTITATDANTCTNSRIYSLTISCPTITVNPATLPDGGVGSNYDQTISATNGNPPYSFAVTSGALPGGLNLSGGGTLSGIATNGGNFNFTITATTTNGCSGSRAYAVNISCPAITLSPSVLTNGTLTSNYSQTITATGGGPPHTFAATSGSLPNGLALSSGGVLSGTPTNTGTFSFTVTATGTNGCMGSQAYAVTISAPPGIYTWINGAGGNWNVPGNWSPNGVPSSNDTAIVNLGATVTLTSAVTVSNLTLGNAKLTGSALTLQGTMNWSDGTVTNTINVLSNALANWSGGELLGNLFVSPTATLTISNNMSLGYNNNNKNGGGSITNYGTVVFAPSVFNAYGLVVIHNAGLWLETADHNFSSSFGTNYFVNSGTFQKIGGTGSTATDWRFNSTGTIQTDTGSLNLYAWSGVNTLHGKMNLVGSAMTAPLTIASNALMNWLGGDLLAPLTVDSGGTLAISNIVTFGYTNNYHNGGGFLTNNGTVVMGGGIYGYGQAIIHNAALWLETADHSIGNQFSSNTFVNNGTLQKIAGTGSTVIDWRFNTTGTVQTDTGTMNFYAWTGDNVLHGTMNLAGTTVNAPLTIASNAVMKWLGGDLIAPLLVAPGGTLAISNIVTMGYTNNYRNGGGFLTNNGTVVLGGGIYGYGEAVIHNAALWLETGDHSLTTQSGTNTFVNTGTFQKAAGTTTTLDWRFNTTGLMDVTNGSLSITRWIGDSTVNGRMNLSAGSMSAPVTVASNAFLTWLGGDMGNFLTIAPGGTLTISNGVTLAFNNWNLGQTNFIALTNYGTVVWSGNLNGYGRAFIHNAALWQTTGNFNFNNTVGSNMFYNVGTLAKLGGASASTVEWNYLNAGTVNVISGSLTLNGASQQIAGSTTVSGGNLSVFQPFPLNGGVLAGVSSVAGSLTNNAAVNPGNPLGQLTVTGNYTQTTNGALNIELGGATAGVNFDRLAVTATALLAGSVNFSLANGFVPTNGSSFTFLTAGTRTGTFNSVNVPPILGVAVNYAATTVTLQVTNVLNVTSPVLVFGPILTNGDFLARYSGTTGITYTVERTPGLSPASWGKLTNAFAPPTNAGFGVGIFELRDPINPATNRFYRAVYPPY